VNNLYETIDPNSSNMQLASHAYEIDICLGLNYKFVIFVGFIENSKRESNCPRMRIHVTLNFSSFKRHAFNNLYHSPVKFSSRKFQVFREQSKHSVADSKVTHNLFILELFQNIVHISADDPL